MELVNPKTGMTHREAREFIRNHFEEFVNKKNVQVGNLNFAADFVDHGADVPPRKPPGPAGAIAYVSRALQKYYQIFMWRPMTSLRKMIVWWCGITGPLRIRRAARNWNFAGL